jgi:hypothetical protein
VNAGSLASMGKMPMPQLATSQPARAFEASRP